MFLLLSAIAFMSFTEFAVFVARNTKKMTGIVKTVITPAFVWLLDNFFPARLQIYLRTLAISTNFDFEEFMGRRNNLVYAKVVSFRFDDWSTEKNIEALILADYTDISSELSAVRFMDHRMRKYIPFTSENFPVMMEKRLVEIEARDFFGKTYRDVFPYGYAFQFPVTIPRFFCEPQLIDLKIYRQGKVLADVLQYGIPWAQQGRKKFDANLNFVLRDAMLENEMIYSACFEGHSFDICGEFNNISITVESQFENEPDCRRHVLDCINLHFTSSE